MTDDSGARKRYYLDAMGIQVWQRRPGMLADAREMDDSADDVPSTVVAPADNAPAVPVNDDRRLPAAESAMPNHADDVPFSDGGAPISMDDMLAAGGPPPLGDAAPVELLDWPQLEAQVSGCRRCALHQGRNQTVFGSGNRQASCMVIGEAPDGDEDRQGQPFVGPAGQLLEKMLKAIGLGRQDVYLTNIVKCLPRNGELLPTEAAACMAYLNNQIALVEPDVILLLGQSAAQNLLASGDTVEAMRGQALRFGSSGIAVVVSYHPADLLRSPADKALAWQDLLRVRQSMRQAH